MPETSKEQLGVLFTGNNLLKTAASLIPLAAPFAEMRNQLEGEKIQKSLKALKETDEEHATRLQAIEAANRPATPPPSDWSTPVAQFIRRTVGVGVVYDGGIHTRAQKGKELILPLGHGCFVDKNEVLTCSEVLTAATELARLRKGKAVIFQDLGWFDFQAGTVDEASGLVILKVTERYADRWKKVVQENDLTITPSIETKIEATTMPWIGQEFGFLHHGEAEDVMGYPRYQFDFGAISHFRRPSEYALKVPVSGVLSGRFLWAGSPVFSRAGTLLGVIADTESYPSDAGRRAVIKSLLGHPKFTTFKKSKS